MIHQQLKVVEAVEILQGGAYMQSQISANSHSSQAPAPASLSANLSTDGSRGCGLEAAGQQEDVSRSAGGGGSSSTNPRRG